MSATVEGRAPRCPCGPCGWTSGGPVKNWQRLRPVSVHKICPQSPQTTPSSPPTPSTLGGYVCHRHGGPCGWTPSGRPCRRRPCHPSWPDTRPLLGGLWPSHRLTLGSSLRRSSSSDLTPSRGPAWATALRLPWVTEPSGRLAERAGASLLAMWVKLSTTGRVVPAAGPSQSTAATRHAPKAAPAASTLSWHLV